MFKLNKKGFALAETIIVSTFVLVIFIMIFSNLLPLMGEYEKRENYDDVDSVYKTYYIKDYLERNKVNISENKIYKKNDKNENEFCYLENSDSEYCNDMLDMFGVETIIITGYSITDSDSFDISKSFKDYIKNIPTKTDDSKRRITVEYKVTIEKESDEGKKDIYRYSTIGVNI